MAVRMAAVLHSESPWGGVTPAVPTNCRDDVNIYANRCSCEVAAFGSKLGISGDRNAGWTMTCPASMLIEIKGKGLVAT